ncbi:MAG: DNA-3-methyladenine glycosylase [Candidatus Limnocylindria bacterium]
MRLGPRLRRSFYARPTLEVARDLLGKILVYEGPEGFRAARLVEVEGYLGAVDPASHAFRGAPTGRTAPMFGPPGRTYVYFVYGMYFCMNVVAERAGTAGAALLRGAEPVLGLGDDPRALAGPGKLCRALGITTAQTNWDLVTSPLRIHSAPQVPDDGVLRTPRIGLNPGATKHEPWRFVVRGSAGASRG